MSTDPLSAALDRLRTAHPDLPTDGGRAWEPVQDEAPTTPRFVAQQLGPRGFVAHDTVSQLDYDLSFTRDAAQRAADRRNAASSKEHQ